MVSTARTDTTARWTKAAERAALDGIRVMQLPTSGVWIAASGTDAATAYVVTETGCECYAGANGDPVCKHRAALRLHLGSLALPAAELRPEVVDVIVLAASTQPTAHRMCPDCLDTGVARISTGWRLSDWIAVPCRCGADIAA